MTVQEIHLARLGERLQTLRPVRYFEQRGPRGAGSGGGAISLIGGSFTNAARAGFGARIACRFMGGIGIGVINCTLVVRVGATIDCTAKPAARIAITRTA